MTTVSIVGVVTTATTLVTLFIFGYAAFWAFNIRRSLVVRLYRNHALGAAIVALGFALLDVERVLVNASILVVPAVFLTGFALFLIIFYWVDSAPLSARRADPLFREVAKWKRLRKPLWVTIVVTIGFSIGSSVAGYAGYGGVFLIPFLLVGISGVLILPIAAGRSKDIIFNKHLRWFGAFFVFVIFYLFVSFAVGSSFSHMNPTTLLNSPLNATAIYIMDLISLIGLSGAGYCLYKSAISLIPLKQLPPAQHKIA